MPENWSRRFLGDLDKVVDAIGGSFNVKGKEIHGDGFARIQRDDVDALLAARVGRWEIGRRYRSSGFRKRSSANCFGRKIENVCEF